ncbi:hypothetical protein SBA4_2020003 [Candidatus Sulfopaludibacter sp. SbA4]|nr:hypothetical protein SBA4_2020003 [Candidatus Sulfopaludibacter sp. SbA4]
MPVNALAAGARVEIRSAEWIVRRVDATSTGGYSLLVTGVSEIVRDKEARFLTEIEGKGIKVLDPAETELVPDPSPQFRNTRLYLESLLRQSPPTDTDLWIGQRAAIDDLPFQLDPALQALDQPRQRILMADSTGLGKTIEVGVLLSELIKRGRGKRILVVTVKSMMTQFQKEMWSRFTIPLVRLDSVGIDRIRTRIPANANPFHYYDRAIISIDTLKASTDYRVHLERCRWDVIVIDEAQNVAVRGSGRSLRAKLADLLSRQSDTLIMTCDAARWQACVVREPHEHAQPHGHRQPRELRAGGHQGPVRAPVQEGRPGPDRRRHEGPARDEAIGRRLAQRGTRLRNPGRPEVPVPRPRTARRPTAFPHGARKGAVLQPGGVPSDHQRTAEEAGIRCFTRSCPRPHHAPGPRHRPRGHYSRRFQQISEAARRPASRRQAGVEPGEPSRPPGDLQRAHRNREIPEGKPRPRFETRGRPS